jgi:putative peptide maturation dehydrogenase
MLIRRCAVLYLEPRESLDFDLGLLFSGERALDAQIRWMALAPHRGDEVEVSAAELAVLGAVGESLWMDRSALDARFGSACVDGLLARGLLVSTDPEHAAWRERDERLRRTHWRPASAALHSASRWQGVRHDLDERLSRFREIADMVAEFGPPPPEVSERAPADARLPLPMAPAGPLDAPLQARYTGRNYDPQAVLPLATASRLLQRTFGAQARRELAPGTVAIKKTSPSGGSLHPTTAYLLAQRVEGVAPGLYHYHPVEHALEPVRALTTELASEHALRFVAGQTWFRDAPLQVVLVSRFERNFWKYRNHAKAYRAVILDIGHLSQTFYLLAAEAGLPAFITAAINEVDIAEALGLDGIAADALAVCGCGPALAEPTTVEFRS